MSFVYLWLKSFHLMWDVSWLHISFTGASAWARQEVPPEDGDAPESQADSTWAQPTPEFFPKPLVLRLESSMLEDIWSILKHAACHTVIIVDHFRVLQNAIYIYTYIRFTCFSAFTARPRRLLQTLFEALACVFLAERMAWIKRAKIDMCIMCASCVHHVCIMMHNDAQFVLMHREHFISLEQLVTPWFWEGDDQQPAYKHNGKIANVHVILQYQSACLPACLVDLACS